MSNETQIYSADRLRRSIVRKGWFMWRVITQHRKDNKPGVTFNNHYPMLFWRKSDAMRAAGLFAEEGRVTV